MLSGCVGRLWLASTPDVHPFRAVDAVATRCLTHHPRTALELLVSPTRVSLSDESELWLRGGDLNRSSLRVCHGRDRSESALRSRTQHRPGAGSRWASRPDRSRPSTSPFISSTFMPQTRSV